ncbi:MAG: hypothetical protein ACXVC6_01550 [Bacteroidia bacterium]
MKKILLPITALLIITWFVSCKKDRTCNCTTSTDGGPVTNTSFVIKHVTKNQALAHSCVTTTQKITDSTGTKTTTTTCKLAK